MSLLFAKEATCFNPIFFIRSNEKVEYTNQTDTPIFFLMGFTDDPGLQSILFCLFLTMYLVTILGNLLIILAVKFDSRLQTPMYFFLSNLSFNDICFSTTTIPKMLANIQLQDQSITYTSCLTQTTFALVFGGLENCLLGVMAYDRYVAICHPLRYTVIVNTQLCGLLIGTSLLFSVMHALLQSLMVLRLSFCTNLKIPHFFCELAQIIKLACSDTLINYILLYVASILFTIVPVSGIIFSYTQIVSSVLRMRSTEGKLKAFSTCGSHLSVVSLFYGMGFGVYISSAITESSKMTLVASVMYIVVPQMLNPFIYSLRNRDMKGALKKLLDKVLPFL